jgi:NAD-dependent deacetylase
VDDIDFLIERAAKDLVKSRHAIALTGAGISTESGIPDFRGPNGIWTKNPEAERLAYQTYHTFLRDPGEYWEVRLTQPYMLGALEEAEPNPGHYALAGLEKMGILKCVITQNIDGLHEKSGSQRILEYHGSVLKLRCPSCGSRFKREEYDLDRLLKEAQLPPLCSRCKAPIKSDVVHFNEPIPSDVAYESMDEAEMCDLMLICGTSAVVHPFASLPHVARQRGIQMKGLNRSSAEETQSVIIIEINAEPTPLTTQRISDYLIQGKTAAILPRLADYVNMLSSQADCDE